MQISSKKCTWPWNQISRSNRISPFWGRIRNIFRFYPFISAIISHKTCHTFHTFRQRSPTSSRYTAAKLLKVDMSVSVHVQGQKQPKKNKEQIKLAPDLSQESSYPSQAEWGTGGHTRDLMQFISRWPVGDELCSAQKHFSSSQMSCSSRCVTPANVW